MKKKKIYVRSESNPDSRVVQAMAQLLYWRWYTWLYQSGSGTYCSYKVTDAWVLTWLTWKQMMLLLSLFVVLLGTETIYFLCINDMKHVHVGLAVSSSPFYTPLSMHSDFVLHHLTSLLNSLCVASHRTHTYINKSQHPLLGKKNTTYNKHITKCEPTNVNTSNSQTAENMLMPQDGRRY